MVSGKAIIEKDTVQKIQEPQQTVGSAKKKSRTVGKKSPQKESGKKTEKKQVFS